MPPGFTAEAWRHALGSGRILEVPTEPPAHRLPRALLAPVQFLRWTIRARIMTPRRLAFEQGGVGVFQLGYSPTRPWRVDSGRDAGR